MEAGRFSEKRGPVVKARDQRLVDRSRHTRTICHPNTKHILNGRIALVALAVGKPAEPEVFAEGKGEKPRGLELDPPGDIEHVRQEARRGRLPWLRWRRGA